MFPQIHSIEEYTAAYEQSVADPQKFWGAIARHLVWQKPWTRVLGAWNFSEPRVSWFEGGKLNLSENCIDRHLATLGEKTAIVWEPNDSHEAVRKITFNELHELVCRCANVLKNNGVKKGDRVAIYMPMVPEAAVAMLACARIGAVHSVVFGGFSAASLAGRIQDASCTTVITADGGFRGAKDIALKNIVDEALATCPSVARAIVLKRTGKEVPMLSGRDVWWHDEMAKAAATCPPEMMDAEDNLFILYTSGSTGKPKGVVHTTGGYAVFVGYSFANVFQPRADDVYWCTADVGWVTGHSYLVYGPLLNGVTTVMFEGIPTYPDAGRFWNVIDKHQVNLFYTAPTAIRSLMAQGDAFVKSYKLDSLRVLGSVGEPINEEAWEWYHDNIGKGRCPIVDTWWQTETGGILISPLAGIGGTKPSFAMRPLPGVQVALVDDKGVAIEGNDVSGNLCIKFPWPAMLRTTYGDHERCRKTYFAVYPGYYATGDGCRRDAAGDYRITGRSDDVIKVSGHRIGTAEVEDAINLHDKVTESAVVGVPHEIKGQGIYAFVIAAHGGDEDGLRREIMEHIVKAIGSLAKPEKIQFVRELPKTRSGKIMRRILRKIAEGDTEHLGDTTTLLDPGIVDEIKRGAL